MSEPLLRRINREQMMWRAVDVEQLIGGDHPARAIWDLVGRLHLDGFYQGIECSEEEGGRPAYDPRLPISLWREKWGTPVLSSAHPCKGALYLAAEDARHPLWRRHILRLPVTTNTERGPGVFAFCAPGA
jgi:hypothetical protein